MNNSTLVVGPSYLDIVIRIFDPIISDDIFLDQSLPYISEMKREKGKIIFKTDNGSELKISLPDAFSLFSVAVLCADIPDVELFKKEIVPSEILVEIGGMGSGYAAALNSPLVTPFRDDYFGERLSLLQHKYKIETIPILSKKPSDLSIVILNDRGEKLAGGIRESIDNMEFTPEIALAAKNCEKIIFCGADNYFCRSLVEKISEDSRELSKIILAPSRRNILSVKMPYSEISKQIAYLTLNRGEWELFDEESRVYFIKKATLITITDGKDDVEIIFLGEHTFISPKKPETILDVNRAGETFSAYIIKRLDQITDIKSAENIVRQACEKAVEQLGLKGFDFPKL